jgi:MoaA/NifB/PqqE/SkfB family radical SAM enzyme
LVPLSCIWDITHVCNYRCPYCRFDWESPELYARHKECTAPEWLAFWKRLFEKIGSFEILLQGGEPSAHAWFFDLTPAVGEWHRFMVTTNLSWDVEKGIERFDPKRFEFSASFHPHYVEMEKFLAKAKRLAGAGFPVGASIVAYPPIFDELPEYVRRFETERIEVGAIPFNGEYNGRRYPEAYAPEQKAWLRRRMHRASAERQLDAASPRGRLCEAGVRYFRLYPNGDAFRCYPVIPLGSKPLGNIRDEAFSLMERAAPCPADKCACNAEFRYLT